MHYLDSLHDDIIYTILSYSYPDGFLVCKRFSRILRMCRQVLDLGNLNRSALSNSSIENAIWGSTRTKCLIVGGWIEWSNLHISRLIQSKHFRLIKFLSFRDCSKITFNTVNVLLKRLSNSLIGVDLFNCHRLSCDTMLSIFHFPNLQTLCLGSFIKSFYTNETLKRLFPPPPVSINSNNPPVNCKISLKRLDLIGCKSISDISPIGVSYLSDTLEYLDLTGLGSCETIINLSNLKKLKHLFIPGLDIPCDVLYEILINMPFLESLDISGSPITLKIINAIANTCKLSHLKVSKCNGFDNICLRKLLTSFERLTVLDASHCWKLTESFIANSIVKSGKLFSQFGIYQCSLDMANVKMLLAKAGAESVKLYNHNEINIARAIDFKQDYKNHSASLKRKRYNF